MKTLNRLLTIALGLFLISAGVAKFTTGHVFQYIEFKSGIDLFYPFVNNLTGIAELLAGAAILHRPSRLIGAVSAFGLMIGAIGFHLSPWLGTSSHAVKANHPLRWRGFRVAFPPPTRTGVRSR